MPLYEFECDACGHRFERIQKFSDPIADTCPKCGGSVHKLQSAPAIQFKGSGFYITDYAKKEHTAAAKADSADGGSTDAKSEGGAAETKDTKPTDAAAKTDTKADKPAASTGSSTTTSSSTPSAASSSSTPSTPSTKKSTSTTKST